MRPIDRSRALALLALLAVGCGDGVSANSGLTEPVRVRGGQFFEGSLPSPGGGPEVLTIESPNNLITAGQTGKKLSGDAAKGATSVAVRFDRLGTGYWVVPVGPPDPQVDGALTWEILCDFNRAIPPGSQSLSIAAVDASSRFGAARDLPLLVQAPLPTGRAVISLVWDTDADLDLHLVAPNGRELDPKHLTTAGPLDDGAAAPPPGAGVLDRDSNAACAIDGIREESVVFADKPAPGRYLVRVDMFDACGAPAADFVLTVRVGGALMLTRKGRLIDADADGGGAGSGLFVVDFLL